MRVADERNRAEAWVEKDYYLSEALRLIAQTYPKETVLKGGTSLFKSWLLLDRVSDDIDLFLRGDPNTPFAFRRVRRPRAVRPLTSSLKGKGTRDALQDRDGPRRR